MIDYQAKVALADKYAGKSLPVLVAEYHECGDFINSDEVFTRRSAALGLGYPIMVSWVLRQHPEFRGVPDGSTYAEKFFKTLDDARDFAQWYLARVDVPGFHFYRMNREIGERHSQYHSLSFVGSVNVKNPSRSWFVDEQVKQAFTEF